MIVLIDTLAILYRSYHAIADLQTKDGTPTNALFGLTTTLLRIGRELDPEHIIACYDSPEQTLRQQEHASYKATREAPEDDFIEQIERSKTLLKTLGVHTIEKAGHEADDLLGSLAKKITKDEEVVIVTCDGDLLQLTTNKRVRVYFLRRGMSDFVLYDEEEAEKKNKYPVERIIDYKGLAGDSSDNISGVRGIGDTYAKKLILAYGSLEDIYSAVKQNKLEEDGFTKRITTLLQEGEKDAFLSRDLATIHSDIPVSVPYKTSPPWKELLQKKHDAITEEFNALAFNLPLKTVNLIINRDDDTQEKAEDTPSPEYEDIDETLLKKTAIALWVLHADKTNATAEEILEHTRTHTLDEALQYIEKELEKEGRLSVWKDIEEPLIPVLEHMEEQGIRIDTKKLKALQDTYHKEAATLEKEIYTMAGKEFNIQSPKQLGEVLFDDLQLKPPKSTKTSKGNRSTKEAILLALEEQHTIIPHILRFRHVKKLTSTYLDVFAKILDAEERLHTTLIQNGTTTGRLSSRDPNLQNIPIRGEEGTHMRQLFIPKQNMVMVAADYSQMELRIAAILSGDKNLINIFKEGTDVHTSVAAQMFRTDPKNITKEQRGRAKAVNFGILYGMGAQALSKSLQCSMTEAKEFLEQYKQTFATLIHYLDERKKEARETGGVKTAFSRYRPLQEINSSLAFIRAQAERMAINAPIQGTEADIIKIAMVRIEERLQKEKLQDKCVMVLQIHDELLFEVSPDIEEQAHAIIKEEMEGVFPKDQQPIPMAVDIRSGNSWGDLA